MLSSSIRKYHYFCIDFGLWPEAVWRWLERVLNSLLGNTTECPETIMGIRPKQ